MPRLASSGARPDWNRLYEQAAGQGGYFTVAELPRQPAILAAPWRS